MTRSFYEPDEITRRVNRYTDSERVDPMPLAVDSLVYDFTLGRDQLSGVMEYVRVRIVDIWSAVENPNIQRVRLKAIGGGPTNIPRWEGLTWPMDVRQFQSAVKVGTLKPVIPC